MSIRNIKSASSLSELALACRSVAKNIDKDVNAIKQEAASKLSFRLIYETPVDESTALSNWQVSLVFPTSTLRPAYRVGEQGSTKAYSAAQAYRAAAQMIKQAKPRIDLVVTNNLTYIHALNAGSSKQQPSAFFVQRITAQVRDAAYKRLKEYLNGD